MTQFKKIFFNKNINLLDRIYFFLFLSFPAIYITGPFLTDFIVSLFAISFLLMILKKKIELNNYILSKKYFMMFLCFYFVICINSLFAPNILMSLKSSFFHIRFLFFSFMIFYLLNIFGKQGLKLFFKFFCYTVIFVCFDTIYQLINTKSLFGYPMYGPRLTGPFGDEQVVGSYLARILPLILSVAMLIEKKINYPLKFFIFIIILVIFLSGERVSLFYGLFFLFFAVLILNSSLKKIMITFSSVFLITAICMTTLISLNKNVQKRWISETACQLNIGHDLCKDVGSSSVYKKELGSSNRKVLFSLSHEAHFLTAYKIFVKNKFFGAGLKSFRYLCDYPDYYVKFGCTTHPHNILLLFLSETGLFGVLFLLILSVKIYFNIFKLIKKNFKSFLNKYDLAEAFLLVSFAQSFFIFLPSGNLFNNWLSSIIYLPLGIYFFCKKENSEHKKQKQ